MPQVFPMNVLVIFSCAEGQNLFLGVFQLVSYPGAIDSSMGCRGPCRRGGITDYVTLITQNDIFVVTSEA